MCTALRDTSLLAAPFDPAEDPAGPAATLTTDAQGVARSEPLEYGCYYAVETTASVGHALDPARHYFEIREDEAVIYLELTDDVLPVNHGGVMLRYRNIWDGTEIAKAWGYNAETSVTSPPRSPPGLLATGPDSPRAGAECPKVLVPNATDQWPSGASRVATQCSPWVCRIALCLVAPRLPLLETGADSSEEYR